MAFEYFNVKIVSDKRREVECYLFSLHPIEDKEAKNLTNAHHLVYDMFLAAQPIVLVQGEIKNTQGAGEVAENIWIVSPEHYTPPYETFLINTHAFDVIEGQNISEKLAYLIDFYLPKEQKGYLTSLLTEMIKKNTYLVKVC